MTMHQTVKKIFRFSVALCIFVITAALVMTCLVKTQEILHADRDYQDRKVLDYQTDHDRQYILVSNNQKPDQAALVVLKDHGYVAKVACVHYQKTICIDDYNLFSTRYIQQVSLQAIGSHLYFRTIQWNDIKTSQLTSLSWSEQDIQQFYQNDITNLKYILGALILFSMIGIYVCYRLIRNFKQFLER
ncbi:hypothetical protein [Acinetobacter ihumii]|uniref:hypothetical protein n=1 Tax=Acinetobacter ihumii TaxID=2483802 RepID=UPI001D181643|nr:hypothetical protein [Acinetobacter ihumii]